MEQQKLKHLLFALLTPECPIHDTHHAQTQVFGDCPFLSLSVNSHFTNIRTENSDRQKGTTSYITTEQKGLLTIQMHDNVNNDRIQVCLTIPLERVSQQLDRVLIPKIALE